MITNANDAILKTKESLRLKGWTTHDFESLTNILYSIGVRAENGYNTKIFDNGKIPVKIQKELEYRGFSVANSFMNIII
jgi:hypothetical protein